MYSEAAWSLIDERPMFLYVKPCDAHICYWNGIATTRTYALLIYYTYWLNLFPSESMKQAAWAEFQRAYRMNTFGTRAWDNMLERHNSNNFHTRTAGMISRNNSSEFFKSLSAKFSSADALEWFKSHREIVKNDIEF